MPEAVAFETPPSSELSAAFNNLLPFPAQLFIARTADHPLLCFMQRHNAHAGTDRIELDIAVAGQHVGLAVHQAGFVAAFPQGADALGTCVELPDILALQRLHHAGDRASGWRS